MHRASGDQGLQAIQSVKMLDGDCLVRRQKQKNLLDPTLAHRGRPISKFAEKYNAEVKSAI